MKLMYNINIIKVKEIGGKSMLYKKENYETYFGIVNTLQSMDSLLNPIFIKFLTL